MDKLDMKIRFEAARYLYPGTKRGPVIEWQYFMSLGKFNGRRSVIIPLLVPAIKKQIAHRKAATDFVPPWKHFKSWVYNSYWTLEFGSAITDPQEIIRKRQAKQRGADRENIEGWLREQTSTTRLAYAAAWPNHKWLVDEIEGE